MRRFVLGLIGLTFAAGAASAQPPAFPKGFKTMEIAANGVTIHTRIGGAGPAVVMLHGFGETGDMWSPLAAELAKDHLVIVPDLRGLGLSSKATSGFEKKTQAGDIVAVLDALKVENAALVTHDIGNMVGYAFAAMHPGRVTRFVIMDAPLPGIGPWEEILKDPILWHFRFGGPDMERLVAGRERIYLDRFWNDLSDDPKGVNEGTRRHYAKLYARPGAMHSGFSNFAAFDQDAIDNRELVAKTRLTMPVLAVGGSKSFGLMQAFVTRFVADDVKGVSIPGSGHWLMEEQPEATVAAIRAFFDETEASANPIAALALGPDEIEALERKGAGAGTSGVSGIQTTVLAGDPAKPGPYAIEIRVPANTQIAAHTHRDDRMSLIVSGEWHFGYGDKADAAGASTLTPGGFYSEPAGKPHFAFTGDKDAVVYVTGYGPSDTEYVEGAKTGGQ